MGAEYQINFFPLTSQLFLSQKDGGWMSLMGDATQ